MNYLLLAACLALVALVFVILKRIFFPARYEMDEGMEAPEFDLRAATLPDDIANAAARHALVKTLAKQRYTLNFSKKESRSKAIRHFFRGY
ncbi:MULTISPECIES: hypothetical protein [unclassified Janthinobacterium]|uniref:hypothetical protein n=1 Tax=unclassified Janthinobacterium TaxID=2610881 RepID=UPI0011145809|nr:MULTISPECIES: hypothetical protein [unclassified Janthinobacterium]